LKKHSDKIKRIGLIGNSERVSCAEAVRKPICPHTLSNRPLILPLASTPSVKAVNPKPATILGPPGQLVTELSAGDQVTVRRSTRAVRLMHLEDSSFFETLRAKLHWRGANL
jgi:NAD+ kinase